MTIHDTYTASRAAQIERISGAGLDTLVSLESAAQPLRMAYKHGCDISLLEARQHLVSALVAIDRALQSDGDLGRCPLYGITDDQFAAMVRHVRGCRHSDHARRGSPRGDLLAMVYTLISDTRDPDDAVTAADDIASHARAVADEIDETHMQRQRAAG